MFDNEKVNAVIAAYQVEYRVSVDYMEYGTTEYRTVTLPEISDSPIHVSFVESSGGEGDGAPTQQIYKLETGLAEPVFIRIDGTYSSWSETQWDRKWYIVNPKTITKVIYERD